MEIVFLDHDTVKYKWRDRDEDLITPALRKNFELSISLGINQLYLMKDQIRTWLYVKDLEDYLKSLKTEDTVSHIIMIDWWNNTEVLRKGPSEHSGIKCKFDIDKEFIIGFLTEKVAKLREKITYSDEQFLELFKN